MYNHNIMKKQRTNESRRILCHKIKNKFIKTLKLDRYNKIINKRFDLIHGHHQCSILLLLKINYNITKDLQIKRRYTYYLLH